MNINEVRIGNLIQIGKNNTQMKVFEITYDRTLEFCINQPDLPVKEFTGIPLTEEWIEKFGFELYDYEIDDDFATDEEDNPMKYYRKFKNQRIFYTVGLMPDGFNEFGINNEISEVMLNHDIKYVHQLQNIYFALTNTELEIK